MRIITLLIIATIILGTSACKKDKIEGCMDPNALNYNPDAEVDDGSCVYPEGPRLLEGRLLNDTTLSDWRDGVDYTVKGAFDVHANVMVEPGVEIEVQENGGIYVLQNSIGKGTFNAVGTSAKPIIIKGAKAQKGYWDKVYFNSTSFDNQIVNVHLQHGGGIARNGEKAMMHIGSSGGGTFPVKIQNSIFEDSDGYGLYLHTSNADISGFSKNIFRNNNSYPLSIGIIQLKNLDGIESTYELNNTVNMIEVTGRGRSELEGIHIWTDAGIPYNIKETIELGASGSNGDITITEGAEFIFEAGNGVNSWYGTLTIQGTASKPVKMNSISKTPGSWRGIYLGTNNIKNVFNYLEISNGGFSNWGAGGKPSNIQVGDNYNPSATLVLNNSKIQNSSECGVFVKTPGNFTENGNTYLNNFNDYCN